MNNPSVTADAVPPQMWTRTIATGEIDLELLTFIERYATNLARWDILLFFGRNPSAHDRASSIANSIGRHRDSVEKELEDLVYLGVLNVHENGQGPAFELSRIPFARRAVVRLAQRFDTAGAVGI